MLTDKTGQEELEVLPLAVVRRRRHQQEVEGQTREELGHRGASPFSMQGRQRPNAGEHGAPHRSQ